MSPRIEGLRDAVQAMHQCKAEHVSSVPIREMFGGRLAWEGVVEIFNLTGSAKAKRCYAWSYSDGKESKFVTVLEIHPVVSPQTAVRASIMAEAKRNDPNPV